MKFKLYKKADLHSKLELLTGVDFSEAEAAARNSGDRTNDIIMSRRFYAALAARAYKIPFEDIQELSIGEYTAITGDVGNFLLASASGEVKKPQS